MKRVTAYLIFAIVLAAALALSAAAAEILLETADGYARAAVSGDFDGEIKVVLCAFSDTGRFSGVRLFSGDCDTLKDLNMTLSVPENGSAKLFVLDGSHAPASLKDKLSFSVQPVPQTVSDREIRLTAEAKEREDAEYSYQWYENGVLMPGETSKALTLSPAHEEKERVYLCKVTENRGGALNTAFSDGTRVVFHKKEINVVWFGGFPVSSFAARNTADEMLGERYGVPVNSNSVTIFHSSEYTAYNAYSLFTSATQSSSDVIEYSSENFKKYITAPDVDLALLQVGRDQNLTSQQIKDKETASFRKIAKTLSENSPGACIVLIAPYGHTVGFEKDFTGITSHAEHAAEINARVNEIKTAILNDGYIKDVKIAPVCDAFEEYAGGDAELLKKALFRPERWATETAAQSASVRGANLANRASALGAYLTAATVYAAITGESPVGLETFGARYYFVDGDLGSFYDTETAQLREELGQSADELKTSLQKAAHRAVFGNEDYPEETPARFFTEEAGVGYTEGKPESDGYFLNGALSDEKNKYYSIGYYLANGKLYKAGETVPTDGAFDADGVAVKDAFTMPAKDITLKRAGNSPIEVAVREDASLGSDLLVCGGAISGTLTYKVKYGGVSDSVTPWRYGHFLPLTVTLPESGRLNVSAGKEYAASLTGKEFELILPIDEKKSDIVLSWNGVERVLKTAGLDLLPREGFRELRTMGFAFFDRGMRFQYEQLGMDRASLTNNRLRRHVLPEFANMQTFKYLDCSSFVKNLFEVTYGYEFGGRISPGELLSYPNCRVFYYEITGQESPEEQSVIVGDFKNTLEPGDAMLYGYTKDVSSWKDVTGHVMFYAGGGMMLHSTGSDYDYSGAKDAEEWQGTVRYESADTLFDPASSRYLFYNNGSSRAMVRFAILRGLDEIDVSRDLTEEARIREAELSDIFIERVTSHAPGRGFGKDEEVTVTTFIENRGARAKTLVLSDTLPAGLVLAGGEISPGAVTFKSGEKKTFTFKVKASAGARYGETYTVSGAVSGYPINDIDLYYCNTVKNTAAFKGADLSGMTASSDADMIKKIYDTAGYEDVVLPEAEAAAQTVFPKTSVKYYSSTRLYSSLVDSYSGAGVWKLTVPGIIGGKAVRLSTELFNNRIRKLTEHQLCAGDVLLACGSMTENGAGNARYYIYLGAQRFAYLEEGAVKEVFSNGILHASDNSATLSDLLSSMAGRPAYAVLRPSQGFKAGNDDHTGDWED
ncbi:MAG: hypothetical protein IJS65_05060 [Clostridia bacterium]|nr:hypothetical protein [Clostridia bacterium]